MSWNFGWRPYVPVAQRRANAARQVAKMAKGGKTVSPVNLKSRAIATTFWGKAWCDNLEAYSDFANRLPRGRTYIRNGSVVDLQIAEGKVTAIVSGSELYRITIQIKPLAPDIWKCIKTECAGKIDSLIELLQGRLSEGVMRVVTNQKNGLFPSPSQIDLDCSCPDWADMCKHVAAALYGVGARLDEAPHLLFQLRGVNPEELVSAVSVAEATQQTGAPTSVPGLSDAELGDVFGIELASPSTATPALPQKRGTVKPTPRAAKKVQAKAKPKTRTKPAKKRPAPGKKSKSASRLAQ
jgi:uncharacterized Zn finger protein